MTGVAPEFTRRDLQRLGLVSAADTIRLSPLPGGVSSDIFKVEAGGRVFVVKRALSKLRVADDWRAPTSRNRHEADWLEAVARILPGAAPTVLARDDQAGLFTMEYSILSCPRCGKLEANWSSVGEQVSPSLGRLRTGLDSRVVAANVKQAGERADPVRSRLVGCAVTSSWTGDGKWRCLSLALCASCW